MDRAEDSDDPADVPPSVRTVPPAPRVVALYPVRVPAPMPASAFAVSREPAVIPFPQHAGAFVTTSVPAPAPEIAAPPVEMPSVPGPLPAQSYYVFKDIRLAEHTVYAEPTPPMPIAEPAPGPLAATGNPQLTSTAAVLPVSLLADPARMPRAYSGPVAMPMPMAMPTPTPHVPAPPQQRPAPATAPVAIEPPVQPTLPVAPMAPEGIAPAATMLAAPPPPTWQAPASPPAFSPPPAATPSTSPFAQARPAGPVARLGDYVPAETPARLPRNAVAANSAAPPLARQPAAEPALPRAGWWAIVKRALRYLGLAVAAYFAFVLLALVVFRFVNPPTSALMVQQRFSGQDIIQEWTPLESISPNVVRAVLVSEDGRFCQHNGVDFEEMQAAIERAGDGPARGASTISMQVVKNLFLWPSKSYIRKAIEIPLTYVMELLWPKRRIMEVYLNIAEWGPGIFGVEAASQFHFNKHAVRLSEREAARLAVALPNPYLRDAGDPGPQTMRLAGEIQSRMHAASGSQTGCVLGRD